MEQMMVLPMEQTMVLPMVLLSMVIPMPWSLLSMESEMETY